MKNSSDPFEMAWAMVRKEIRGEVGTDSNPWKIVFEKTKCDVETEFTESQMTKFIELTKFHGAPPDHKVWMRVDSIYCIESHTTPSETRSFVSNGTDGGVFWVKETPEEIMKLIGLQAGGSIESTT